MSKFEESNFYKALQDFFINADKKTFLQFLAEFYNRTEGIIDKNNIQDDLIKDSRELYLEFNEKGIDDNIVREKVNYFLENSLKIKDIKSQLDTKANKEALDIERKRIDSFTSLPSGSTTGDAELIDGRIGANGTVYDNIGEAIRGQIAPINYLLKSNFTEQNITVLDYWIEPNGNSSDYGGFKHISVPIKTGEKYLIKCKCGNNVRAYILKNSGGYVVSTYQNEAYGILHDYDLEVEIPSTCDGGTLIVNTMKADYVGLKKSVGLKIDFSKVDEGSIPQEKIYGYNDLMVAINEMKDRLNLLNPLYGKKVAFFGDSITASPDSWAGVNGIMGRNNMTGSNNAVGGSTFSSGSDGSNTWESNNINLRLKARYSDNADVDYVIIQGSTNDAFKGRPLGTMLDETDFSTECDMLTFAGAFEDAIRFTVSNWHGKKIGFIATFKIPRNKKFNTYIDMAKQICKKYSVPVLDLWNESGLCAGIQSINDAYFLIDNDYSTEHSGGTHPNKDGYDKYLIPKVEAWMKTL